MRNSRKYACVAALMLAVAGCSQPGAPGTGSQSQWPMPNVVGGSLQVAQDQMQKLTGDPVFLTSSHDATGQGRSQVDDSNWVVCTQNVAPGQAFTIKSVIDFGVVKATEKCP